MPTTETNPTEQFHQQLDAFEKKYDYDVSFLHELLDRSPAAFAAFGAARPMTMFRKQLPVAAYYVATITVMQEEDCGPCQQLNIKKALEAGVERETLKLLLESPDKLPPVLQDVRDHAQRVSRREMPSAEVLERIEAEYGSAAVAELAVCIASVRMYPLLKRALLKEGSCSAVDLSV